MRKLMNFLKISKITLDKIARHLYENRGQFIAGHSVRLVIIFINPIVVHFGANCATLNSHFEKVLQTKLFFIDIKMEDDCVN